MIKTDPSVEESHAGWVSELGTFSDSDQRNYVVAPRFRVSGKRGRRRCIIGWSMASIGRWRTGRSKRQKSTACGAWARRWPNLDYGYRTDRAICGAGRSTFRALTRMAPCARPGAALCVMYLHYQPIGQSLLQIPDITPTGAGERPRAGAALSNVLSLSILNFSTLRQVRSSATYIAKRNRNLQFDPTGI